MLRDLHRALQTALGRDVDLINLCQAPKVLQKEIVDGTGVFVFPEQSLMSLNCLCLRSIRNLTKNVGEFLR